MFEVQINFSPEADELLKQVVANLAQANELLAQNDKLLCEFVGHALEAEVVSQNQEPENLTKRVVTQLKKQQADGQVWEPTF